MLSRLKKVKKNKKRQKKIYKTFTEAVNTGIFQKNLIVIRVLQGCPGFALQGVWKASFKR